MDSVKSLLSDQSKGLHRSQGVLCYLFRHVLLMNSINLIRWNKHMQRYFEKPHNQKNPDKGNLNKALIADDMQWGGFRKAIDFLNPYKATLHFKITWSDKTETIESVIVDPTENESILTPEDQAITQHEIFRKAKVPTTRLARLFRKIAVSRCQTLSDWQQCFETYARKPISGIGQTKHEIASATSALNRQLCDAKLSWNGFRKGLLVLGAVKEEYTLELLWTKNTKLEGNHTFHPAVVRDPFNADD